MKKSIKQFFNKTNAIHFLVLTGFILFSVSFFYPVLSGKKLIQSDIQQYSGMSRQIQEHREDGEEIYWIDNAFGGMPTYQLGARYPYDFLTPIHKIFQLIPQPSEILFLYLLTAYIFLLIIKMPIPIAILGAFAYGLSTYLLIKSLFYWVFCNTLFFLSICLFVFFWILYLLGLLGLSAYHFDKFFCCFILCILCFV